MLNYIDNNGEFIDISYEKLKALANNNRNLQMLSIKLNTSKEIARELLQKLDFSYMKRPYKMSQYSFWSKNEDLQLEQEYKKNLSLTEISNIHGRTRGAIIARLKHKNYFENNEEIILYLPTIKKNNIKYKNVNIIDLAITKELKKYCNENNINNLYELIEIQTISNKNIETELARIKNDHTELNSKKFLNKWVQDIKRPIQNIKIDIEHFQNVTEEEKEKYIDFGIEIGEIICEFLENENTSRSKEMFKYRMNMIDNETNTLESIGKRYNLTRERIRQIINKTKRKMHYPSIRRLYLNKIVNLINSIEEEEIINYFCYGIINIYNRRFLEFILKAISNDYYEYVNSKINDLINLLTSNINKKQQRIEKIINLIKFPEETKNKQEFFNTLKKERTVDQDNNSGSVYLEKFNKTVEYESLQEKNILELIELSENIIDIKVQSIVIDYSVNGHEYKYYPDFQVLFNDGKMAIIEVKDIYHMGEYFVREKYKALKQFCKKNGMGYLMIDSGLNDYETIINDNINQEKKQQFYYYLKNYSPMKYREYKNIKNSIKLKTREIVNIFSNDEKIRFKASPFIIQYIK